MTMTTPEQPRLAGTLEQTLVLSASGRGSMTLKANPVPAVVREVTAKSPAGD